jgi:hypothetical protein
VLAEELELSLTVQALQLTQEATPEQTRQHSHREEEPRLAGYPALGVRSQAAARYDAMHVGMMG